ncbi:MAG TPA: uroporphyrinogen-III synthase [Gemmatimonadaceae bacterium]|jgi:uroporphyrinogen-III synthase
MRHSLAGRRIVVTRFELDDGPLATGLRRAGAEPIVVPLIGIDPVPDDQTEPLRAIRDFNWIAFTSANGVRMFWARLGGSDRAAFRAHRGIAAVGPATARAVANVGANCALTAPEFVAESLVDALGDVAGKTILWPRAAGARSVMSDTLRARGAEMSERILYGTVALPVADETRGRVLDADAITFTSPSSVHAFVACFGADVAPRVACIGPVTADAARASGLTVHAVGSVFTLDGMVRALTEMFSTEPLESDSNRQASKIQ